MILEADEQAYTIYWKFGARSVIAGRSFNDAYERCISDAFKRSDIAASMEGVHDDRVFINGAWEDRGRPVIRALSAAWTKEQISSLLLRYHAIYVELPNKDQICIDISIGRYATQRWVRYHFDAVEAFKLGWARSIRIYVAEYCEGPYCETGKDIETHHYMVNSTHHFDQKNWQKVIQHFWGLLMATAKPSRNEHPDGEQSETMTALLNLALLTAPTFGSTTVQKLLERQVLNDL